MDVDDKDVEHAVSSSSKPSRERSHKQRCLRPHFPATLSFISNVSQQQTVHTSHPIIYHLYQHQFLDILTRLTNHKLCILPCSNLPRFFVVRGDVHTSSSTPTSSRTDTSVGIYVKPPSSSFTPLFTSTPSSRHPPLGIHRNYTFPSHTSSSSTVQQEPYSLTGSGGQLPQRQKGFKPPLLSLSQPQAQMPTHSLSRVKSNTNVIVVESVPEASSTDNHGFNINTNTSMALRSSTSSSLDSSTLSPTSSDSSVYSKSNKCNQGTAQQPQASDVIPEPIDGDAVSSSGDVFRYGYSRGDNEDVRLIGWRFSFEYIIIQQ
jgi:hypothetical protein